jgi:hypothetical protein
MLEAMSDDASGGQVLGPVRRHALDGAPTPRDGTVVEG